MLSRPDASRLAWRTALPLLLLLGAAAGARAQVTVRVGGPEADSVALWAADAKIRFAANRGDSVTGDNYPPYGDVGFIARRLLRVRDFGGAISARVIKPALDSLGFTTELAEDPAWPGFALVMVRNPLRPKADAIGFLYWRRENELRFQGALFAGGIRPRLKLWRAAKPIYPYECGILSEALDGSLRLMLLGLAADASFWDIENDQTLASGEPGQGIWADVNRDDLPEVVTWTLTPTDSLFSECMDCPKLLAERLLVEQGDGFEVEDQHLLETPYATLVYFVRLLLDGKVAQAERLVREPSKVREALAAGWNKRVVRNPWHVEYRESGHPWPDRMEVRFQGPQGVKRYVFVFARREGHWLIQDWVESKPTARRVSSVTVPPKRGAKTPAPAKRPPGATAPPRKK